MGSQGNTAINGANGSYVDTLGLSRFVPEPRSRIANVFRTVLNGVGAVLSGGGSTTGTGQLDPAYQDLIQKQIEIQQQMQWVSMESNIEKSRHETQMAEIRNARVG